MMDGKRIGARMFLLALLLCLNSTAMALGLGNATVKSYLNQPLEARIQLITRPGDDLSSVTVGLAQAEDFARIGAQREAIAVPLHFAIERMGDAATIVVSSKSPVRDPIVRLILEVNWSSGRLLREYTLFLDPPTVAAVAPLPTADSEDAVARAESPAAPAATLSGDGAAVARDGEYGPVGAGQTLWSIASDWSQGSGASVNQVMLAIQRNNPQAFIHDNINLLRRGAILRMPSMEDVGSLSPEAAREQVQEQNAALGAALATLATEAPLLDQAARESPYAAAPPAAEAEASSQLEILPPAHDLAADSPGSAGDAVTGMRDTGSPAELKDELVRTEEELIAEQQENEHLRERLAELEGQPVAGADSATVTDPELARMEQQMREDRQATEEQDVGANQAAQATPTEEERPQATPGSRAAEPQPWYSNWITWLIVLLVVGAGLAGWVLSRRETQGFGAPPPESGGDPRVRSIKDEAEEILKVLEPAPPAAERKSATITPLLTAARHREPESQYGEAALLDEESADPEVRLDLARAYISMGDKEAARVILSEVIQHGSTEQRAEAEAMRSRL